MTLPTASRKSLEFKEKRTRPPRQPFSDDASDQVFTACLGQIIKPKQAVESIHRLGNNITLSVDY